MRIIPYILYLLLLGLFEVIGREAVGISGVTINLAAFMVMAVSLYKTETVAAWFGFACGLVLAAPTPELMGWHALVLSGLAFVAYNVKERLNLESLYSKLLWIFGGVLMHSTVSLLISGGESFLFRLISYGLSGAVYTTVLALLFFLFKEGVITVKKIRSIF